MSQQQIRFPIAVSQLRIAPGNIREKLVRMIAHITEARNRGAKLIVFPELATTDYVLR